MNPASIVAASPADSFVEGTNSNARNGKRQRVATACDECRVKKVKCDGRRPVCTPCRRRYANHTTCNWGLRKGRSNGTSKDEILRMRRRIAEFENGSRHTAAKHHDQALTPVSPQPLRCGSEPEDHANAMLGLMEEEDQVSLNRIGDSSATGFTNQIKSVIDQQLTPPESQWSSQRARPRLQASVDGLPSKQQPHKLDYILPSRHRADHLLETYWRLVDTLYPFLDKDEVISTYRCLWTGDSLSSDGPIFLSLLNTIFSIACALEPSILPEERVKSADIFYQRAQELLDFSLIHHRSIITVQCFLLHGQYLQSTDDPQQCWIFVGLAIRIAQSLGLDLPSSSAQAQTMQKQQLLRKVWHGCILMDRTLSMVFGRPPMITLQAAAAVPRPMPHQNHSKCLCSTDVSRLDPGLVESHFFIESLKLYELMSDILLTLYSPVSGEDPNEDPYMVYFGSLGAKAIGNIFEMDKKLWLWSSGLPIHLQHNLNGNRTARHRRQANVLWLRYCHIRILLFRPVLSRLCSKYDTSKPLLEEPTPFKVALQCSLTCVKTAFEIIDFFDSEMKGQRQENLDDLLPAWWYSVFYVYTAATVLVAARLHPSVATEVTERAITNTWHVVMKVMGRFQSFGKHAKRCMTALRLLFDQIPQQQQDQQRRSQQQLQCEDQLQQQTGQLQEYGFVPNQAMTDLTNVASAGSSTTYPIEGPIIANPMNAANFGRSATQLAECQALDGNLASQNPVMPRPVNLTTDYFSTAGVYDTYDLEIGSSDMSWLSSIPFPSNDDW